MNAKISFILFLTIFFILPLAANAGTDGYLEVVVVEGDTLISICEELLEDPDRYREIARINRVHNPDRVYPGEKILIPVRLLKGIPYDGVISFVMGKVRVQTGNSEEWKEIHLGDKITQGSRIKTVNKSVVEVTYDDGTSFLMRSGTMVDIKRSVKKKGIQTIHELTQGAGRTITKIRKATGNDLRFKIKTPSAVLAARGTEFRASVDRSEATRSEVLEGTVGASAESKRVIVREGEGTLVRKGEPPSAPAKLLPPPSAVDLKLLYRVMPLQFKFSKVDGASYYRVMMARDSGLKETVKEKVIRPDKTFDIVGVDDGTYYLQSRSIDHLGLEGMPSNAEVVKVRVNPLPPFMETPLDGAEFRERKVDFKWLKVRDALKYHLQVAEDMGFNSLIEDRDDIPDIKYETPELDFGTYYFRISSLAEDGYEGVWSDAMKFSIVPPPPSPPVEKPKVDSREIKIRWGNLGDGIQYHFQLARDEQFSKLLMDKKLEKPETTVQKPDEPGIYYVRTSGIDSEGYEGDFSLPQTFEVKRFPYEVAGIIITGLILLLAL